VYQLKITLQHIQPPVWRRVLVPSAMTLAELHDVIQTVMEWCDSHLHEFVVDGVRYGDPRGDEFGELVDERKTRLNALRLAAGKRFVYTYNFGDDWRHVIDVEAVMPSDPDVFYPVCTEAQRACPPEDIGGPPGYELFLEAVLDVHHEQQSSMLEWVGGEFDPDYVDREGINRWLESEFYETDWGLRQVTP
jgi:hypothetical protein